jgi:hypothetical protein
MVYERCFVTEYKRLPLGEYGIFRSDAVPDRGIVYWQSFTVPFGLMVTNRQLYEEIEAMLPKMRSSDEPDIIYQYPAPHRMMEFSTFS